MFTNKFLKCKRYFFTILFLLLFVLIFVAKSCNFDIHDAMMPEEIQGLKLSRKVTGSEAAKIITRLHGLNIIPEGNVILYYFSEDKQATIYVSFFQQQFQAARYFFEMVKKIRDDSSGFNQYQQFKIREFKIHSVWGNGQTHYLFAHYNYLFWLAIDYSIAGKGLAQILEVDEIELPVM